LLSACAGPGLRRGDLPRGGLSVGWECKEFSFPLLSTLTNSSFCSPANSAPRSRFVQTEAAKDRGWFAMTPVGTRAVGGSFGWNADGIPCGAVGVDVFAFFQVRRDAAYSHPART
jgi:hypothetical protein